MNKEIYFCVDLESYECFGKDLLVFMSTSYDGMERALKANKPIIATTSLAQLSFDLIDKGYDIYLCYKDKKVKIYKGMILPCGVKVEDWNSPNVDCALLLTFMQGKFDELLGIKEE